MEDTSPATQIATRKAAKATVPTKRPMLNKPPARPITNSAGRKTTSAGGSSGDENKKLGFSALVGSTTVSRASSFKAPVAGKTEKRSTESPSSLLDRRPSSRSSTRSPTRNTSKIPATSSSRKPIVTTKFTRPPSKRDPGVLDTKKRLSTIPASPNAKSSVQAVDDDKEDGVQPPTSTTKPPPTRPPLGKRQSTRSVALQQRIREYQLVSDMLRLAMATEGEDQHDNEHIAQEAAATMAKLKADLANATAFEKLSGYSSDEAGLQENMVIGREDESTAAPSPERMGDDLVALEAELAESRAAVSALSTEMTAAQLRLVEFGTATEQESFKVQAAVEAIRAEHATEIRHLLATHASEKEQATLAASTIAEAKAQHILEQERAVHANAIQDFQNTVHEFKATNEHINAQNLKLEAAIANQEREMNGQESVIKSLQDEMITLQQAKQEEMEAASERHQKEMHVLKEKNAKEYDDKAAQIRQEYDHIVCSVKANHQGDLGRLRDVHLQEIDRLKQECRSAELALEKQLHVLGEEKVTIQAELRVMKAAVESERKDKESHIIETHLLQEQLEKSWQSLADSRQLFENDTRASQESAAQSCKVLEERITSLEAQSNNDTSALKSALGDLEAARSQVDTLRQLLETFEKDNKSNEEQNAASIKSAKDEAASLAVKLAEQASSLDAARLLHVDALKQSRTYHAAEMESMRSDLTLVHATALAELQAKYDELSTAKLDLETTHAKQLEELKSQNLTSLADSRKMIADLHEQHLTEIQETKDRIFREQTVAFQEMKDSLNREHTETSKEMEEQYSKKASEASEQHMLALEDLQSSHEKALLGLRHDLEQTSTEAAQKKKDLEQTMRESDRRIEDLQQAVSKSALQVGEMKEKVAQDQKTITKIMSAAEDASTLMAEANKEMDELKQELEIYKGSTSRHESVLNEATERAQVAERALERGQQEIDMAKDQLEGALLEVEEQRALNDGVVKELKDLKAAAANTNALTERLNAAEHAAERSKMKIRELEASLKVTKAELTEAKTNRAAGVDFLGSPSRRKGGAMGNSVEGTVCFPSSRQSFGRVR